MSPRTLFPLTASLLSCLAGCYNPSVRLPTWQVGDPRVEQRALERHDPFPSRSMGPELYTRPPGYIEQRTDVRRLREENALRGLDRNRIPTGPGASTNNPYPDAVRE